MGVEYVITIILVSTYVGVLLVFVAGGIDDPSPDIFGKPPKGLYAVLYWVIVAPLYVAHWIGRLLRSKQ